MPLWEKPKEEGKGVSHFLVVPDEFFVNGLAGLAQLMAVVDPLDGLFNCDGDQQADDDGGDVDEEVAPGMGRLVGWVDVKHKVPGALSGAEIGGR